MAHKLKLRDQFIKILQEDPQRDEVEFLFNGVRCFVVHYNKSKDGKYAYVIGAAGKKQILYNKKWGFSPEESYEGDKLTVEQIADILTKFYKKRLNK